MPLAQRKIGNASVPPIGFGAMGIAAFYSTPDPDEERFKVLDAAYEQGSLHWDTADIYNDSEVLIGKWLAKNPEKRKDIFLATKFGFTPSGANGTPEYARRKIDESLQRLQTDHVDLYYLHRPDLSTPIETTVATMAEFVKAGKVKQLGLSEVTAEDLRRAHAVHPIAALQIEYSPFVLDIEYPDINLLKTAQELGITIVAYSPLGRGLLTGRYRSHDDFEENDFRRTIPKYSKDNFPKILKIVEDISSIGKKHNATAGQVTLAWVLAQSENIVVIPGTKSIKYLVENMGAADVELSPQEISEVRKISEESVSSLTGTRYTAQGMEMVLKSTPALPK